MATAKKKPFVRIATGDSSDSEEAPPPPPKEPEKPPPPQPKPVVKPPEPVKTPAKDNKDEKSKKKKKPRGDAFDIKFSEEPSEGCTTQNYEILSPEEIVKQQTNIITKTMDFLSVSFSVARTLLKYMKWDDEKLFAEFAERYDALCKSAGVDPSATQTVSGKKGKGECLICFDDSTKITTLSCTHGYCPDCWKQYLGILIKEQTQKIVCPAPDCGKVLDEWIIIKLCRSPAMRKKFNQSLIDSFVNGNPLVKWCPAPNCKYAVSLKEISIDRNEAILCKCGFYWCFRCGGVGHEPSTCKELDDWKLKNSGGDDSLNEKFILSITKKCPHCKTFIEKNGGCNHMTCHKCHYHFCWLCLGKFGSGPLGDSSGYSSHKCNIFGGEDKTINQDDDWERFRFYSERFNNHSRSYDIEKRLQVKKDEVIDLLKKKYILSDNLFNYYREAVVQLLIARSCIRNSYIFGFYRPLNHKEIHKDLFEHRQKELEIHTELLSKELEGDAELIYVNKAQIITVAKLLSNSRNALLDVCKFE